MDILSQHKPHYINLEVTMYPQMKLSLLIFYGTKDCKHDHVYWKPLPYVKQRWEEAFLLLRWDLLLHLVNLAACQRHLKPMSGMLNSSLMCPLVLLWFSVTLMLYITVIFPTNEEKIGSFLPTSTMTHLGAYNPMPIFNMQRGGESQCGNLCAPRHHR